MFKKIHWLNTVKLLACLILSSVMAPTTAVSQEVYQRLKALEQSDPELYQLIQMYLFQSRRDVDGGFDWSVADAELDCDEGYEGGFRSCEVELSVESKSHAGSPDDRRANLRFDCSVELRTQDADGYSGYERENETFEVTLYAGRRSTDTVEIDFSFPSYKTIVNVRISNAACDLTDID